VTETRRLFVAVDIDDAARRELARVLDTLARKAEPAGASVRWTPAENLHITLRFIGATPESDLRRIMEVMEPPVPAAPFDVRISGIGTFPGGGAPRVIWASIAAGADALGDLAREVETRLQKAGVAAPGGGGAPLSRNERPFRAHLTLGRVRRGPPRAAKAARRILDGVTLDIGPMTVDRITLYESRMSSKGSTYHQLLRTILGI
jgi:2'-5' RNA ligase